MKLILVLAAAALLTAPSFADRCRDPKTGRAAKCSQAGAVPFSAASSGADKIGAPDKAGRCHITAVAAGSKKKVGQFAACPK